MSIRRGWTVEQNNILKMLKQQRNIKKWSSIARIMDSEFNICGRSGKQCRQRYSNHLEEDILEQRLTFEDEKLLQNLNDRIGNKWSVIAKAFKGRTANFLKNQLYSKLRKSLRKLNKFIKLKKQKSIKQYKLSIVFKIVQTNDFKIFQKQRHSTEDLHFFKDLKEKIFMYAEQPLSLEGHQSIKDKQVIQFSLEIISDLNLFSNKYDGFTKKTKKPRRKYVCEDDIILNSLSNNKVARNLLQENMKKVYQQSESQQSSLEVNYSSRNSMKKAVKYDNSESFEVQEKPFASKKQPEKINKNQNQKQVEKTPKSQSKSTRQVLQLQKMANQNCIIVEQENVSEIYNGYRLLEQSEQCQFIDIQYMDQFQSCSLVDQSLFQ